MLKLKEKEFLVYWQKNRAAEATFVSKLLKGLPVAVFFVLPILLVVLVVYIFIPEWYTKVAPKDKGTFTIIFIALALAALFISFFRMQFKWEENEQLFNELQQKENLMQHNEQENAL